jgi:predicted metal-binding membrane protein
LCFQLIASVSSDRQHHAEPSPRPRDRPGHDIVAARERIVIGAALAALSGLSWLYVYLQMAEMADMTPAAFAPWSAADFVLNFLFWWSMMPGMMLPSAGPMILTFAAINRRKRERGESFVPTALFTAGYLVAWGVFGAAATLADWGLERAALISPATQALAPLWAPPSLPSPGFTS